MTDAATDDEMLDQFRKWLHETRLEAAGIEEPANGAAGSPQRVGLYRLVEEFTALRHEIKLQTRSSRALEERVEAGLGLLADSAALLRSAAAQEASAASDATGKSYAAALADLDEALDRFSWQLQKIGGSLASSPSLRIELCETWRRQSWWRRILSSGYFQLACERVVQAEERSASEPQALLAALRGGFNLIQQRLARALDNAGLARIPTVGRPVDPEQMVVLEVVQGEGQPGVVIDEIRRGYTWKGALLRPAEVRATRPEYEGGGSREPS